MNQNYICPSGLCNIPNLSKKSFFINRFIQLLICRQVVDLQQMDNNCTWKGSFLWRFGMFEMQLENLGWFWTTSNNFKFSAYCFILKSGTAPLTGTANVFVLMGQILQVITSLIFFFIHNKMYIEGCYCVFLTAIAPLINILPDYIVNWLKKIMN